MYAAPNSLFSHNGAGHANTNIIYLITEVMYDSFTAAVYMDINGLSVCGYQTWDSHGSNRAYQWYSNY